MSSKATTASFRRILRALNEANEKSHAIATSLKSKTATATGPLPKMWHSHARAAAESRSWEESDAGEYANLVSNIHKHRTILYDMGLGEVQVSVRQTLNRSAASVGLSMPKEYEGEEKVDK